MSTLLTCPVQVLEAIQRANSRPLSQAAKNCIKACNYTFGSKSRLQRNRDIIATRKAYVNAFETLQSILNKKVEK